MAATATTPADSSARWAQHFRDNISLIPDALWQIERRLSPEERAAVAASLQQFQLGEGAEGRSLLERGRAFGLLQQDPAFAEALGLFIREEQRHSLMLGRYLDREHIPHLRAHWADSVFRRLRKLAGLELACTVLVSAEIISVAFYTALRDATSCPLLRTLCTEVLRDEASHLELQAWILHRLRKGKGTSGLLMRMALHRLLMISAMVVVWRGHMPVFKAAGYSPAQFWQETSVQFANFEERIAAREQRLQKPAFRCIARSAG